MKRVVVVGSGGSGKSTFAAELGKATGLPVIHLDREYWRSGWDPTPKDEWERRIVELLNGERWIIDGNYGGTREMRLRAADTIIFLDLPRRICLYRILKRTVMYYGKCRPDMAEGCPERFDLEFVSWVWNYRHRSRERLIAELERLREKRVIILRNQGQVASFLFERSGSAR